MRQVRKPAEPSPRAKPMRMGSTHPKKAVHTSFFYRVGLVSFRVIVNQHSIYKNQPIRWRLERNGETVAKGEARTVIEAQANAKATAKRYAKERIPRSFDPDD